VRNYYPMHKKLTFRYLLVIATILACNLAYAQLPTVQSAIPVYSQIRDNDVMVVADYQDNIFSAYEIIGTLPGGTTSSQEFHIGTQLMLPPPPFTGTYNPYAYYSDVIIMKQNSAGALQWAKRTQGTYKERVKSIKADNNGNLIVGGHVSGPEGKFWGQNFVLPTDAASVHGFLSKMDTNGNVIWEKVFPTNVTNYPAAPFETPRGATVLAVTNDIQGNIYAQINLHATSVAIDGTTFTNANPVNSVNDYQPDGITAKFDQNGNLIWAKQMTSTHGVFPGKLILNSQNELIITGNVFGDQYYDGQLLTNWDNDSYIMKINSSNGQLIWNKKPAGLTFPHGIDVDVAGNMYIAGGLAPGTYTYGSEVLVNNSYQMSASKALMFKMDASGNILWGKTASRNTANGNNLEQEYNADVKIKSDGHVLFLGGLKHENIDFGNGIVLTNSDNNSYYPNDIFFVEYISSGHPLRAKKLGTYGSESSTSFALKSDGSIAFNGMYRGSTQLDSFTITGGDASQNSCFMAFMSSWNNPTPVDNIAPTAPLNLAITGTTTTSVNLSWTAATDNVGVTSYDVFMNGVYYGYVTGTTMTVTGLSPNTTYSFYVKAKDLFGNVSPNSNTVSATTQAGTGIPFGTDLYISEYVEGSGNNKAIEITNPTNALVDLSDYSLRQQINGTGSWMNDLPLSGYLDTDEAFVIMHDLEDFSCTTYADMYVLSPIDFDGNDPIGLFKNGVLIDIVGNFGSSAVFGTDISLWRNVFNPSTTFILSQWNNFPVDYCDSLSYANPARYALNTSETTTQKKMRIFPNPVKETLFFEEEIMNTKIYNLEGKLIRADINGKQVTVEDLAAGIYLVVGETKNKETFTAKFIKK